MWPLVERSSGGVEKYQTPLDGTFKHNCIVGWTTFHAVFFIRVLRSDSRIFADAWLWDIVYLFISSPVGICPEQCSAFIQYINSASAQAVRHPRMNPNYIQPASPKRWIELNSVGAVSSG